MRKSSGMQLSAMSCLPLLFLVMTAPAISADQKQPEEAPPVKPLQPQSAPSGKRAPAPPATFTPSEKIKADSSVSFPVDI